MKIKNSEINIFVQTLFNLELKGKQSRMRTRMINIISDYYDNIFEKDRINLIEQYQEIDKSGNIIYSDVEKKQPVFKYGFKKEFNELLNEYYHFDLTKNNKDMIETVASVFLDENCDIKVSGQMAIIFDKWCTEFEFALDTYQQQEQ